MSHNNKVMVVEDEAILREAYVLILKKEGFKVYEASNGQEALSLLPKAKPDLVILDILMPVMDGLRFLQEANLREDYPNTKVLAFSNLSDQHRLETAEKLGVTKQILKSSLSPNELVATIRSLLK